MPFTIRRVVVVLGTLALLSGSVGLTGAWYSDVETGSVTIGTGSFLPPIPEECLRELGITDGQNSTQFDQALSNGDIVVRIGTDGDDLPGDTASFTNVPGDTTFGGKDSENDIIFGMGGNDVLDGGAQDDCLFGGDGTDTHHGGNGVDIVYGGEGNDTIFGGSGGVSNVSGDVLRGDHGPMTGTGASPTTCTTTCDDFIYGGAAKGTPEGTPTNDGAGGDARNDIWGGPGNDYLEGEQQSDVMNGEDGNDEMYGLGSDDTLNGGDGDDELIGGAGADTLNGGDGIDLIWNGDRTLIPDQVGMVTDVMAAQESVTPIDESGAELQAEDTGTESEEPSEEPPAESVDPEPTEEPAETEPVEQPGEEPAATDTDAGEPTQPDAPAADADPVVPLDDEQPAAGGEETPDDAVGDEPEAAEEESSEAETQTETLPGGDGDRDVVSGGSGSDTCVAENGDATRSCEDVVGAGETVVDVDTVAFVEMGGGDSHDRDSDDDGGVAYAGIAAIAVLSTKTRVRAGRQWAPRRRKTPAAGFAGGYQEGAAS